jgi:hypothetical protein
MLLANQTPGTHMLSCGRNSGLRCAAICLLFYSVPLVADAQNPTQDATRNTSLPADPESVQTAGQNPPSAQQLGTVSGTVIDSDGDAIAGAQVTLTGSTLGPERKLIADGEGYFSFIGVPAGTFSLTIGYTGFGNIVKSVVVHGSEDVEIEDLVLPVTADMNVDVSPHAQYEMAELDLKAEEKQRIAGFLPNFYVTYDHHAPPLTPGQKFRLSFRSIIDPANFALAGITAGVEQATNGFPGYGQGAQGYGKRYGASIADNTTGDLLGGAVFPILLHQDPRYFYRGTGSFISRALYALSTAVICKGDNGKWQPNYSSVLGDISAGAISNTYYPATDRNGIALTIETGLLNAAEDGIGNLLQEFVFRKITPGANKAP